MEHEALKTELSRLFKEQTTALEDEVFGGLSLAEREEYDRRTNRINELEIEIQTSAVTKKSSQSAKTNQRRQWGKESETDRAQDQARQPYRSRERDSGDSQKSSKRTNKTTPKRGITNEE
jgi:hypothetical protein